MAEETLQSLNERLSLALRSSNAGAWDWDLATDSIHWSPELFDLFGFDATKCKASFAAWETTLHPDDLQVAKERITCALAEKIALVSEYRIIRPNGQLRWISAPGEGIYDRDGKPTRMIGICIDITERKRVEDALRESEEKHRGLFNNAAVGIFRSRLDGSEMLDLNDKYLAILGHTREEVVGKPSANIWADQKEREEMLKNLNERGQIDNLELRLKRADGTIVHCLTSLKLYHEQGILEGTIIDLTERIRAEIEQQESADLFSKAFYSGPLMGTISDIQTGKFLEVNENFVAISGFSKAEAIGATSAGLGWVSQEDRNIMFRELQEHGCVSNLELKLKKKNGEAAWCRYFGEIITVSGKKRLLSLAEDITERKQSQKEKEEMQALLLQSDKLAAIGTLVAGIAHEICNPLAIINGFSRVLAKKLKAVVPSDDSEKTLQIINNSTSRIMSIIDSLRACVQQHIPHLEPMNINEVISEFFTVVQQIAKNDDIEIRQKLTLNAPPVLGNRGKLQQVFIHLLSNASDALQSRPSDRQIVVETRLEGKNVVISFKDNGCGIPESILGKIWDPFFTTKNVGQGVGLGLSICQATIESFGGSLKVSSNVGQGTTYYIKLPFIYSQDED